MPAVSTEKQPAGILLADGVYEFTVISAAEELSKKGNPMLSIVLEISGNEGKSFAYDWLGDWCVRRFNRYRKRK